ncbi:hypothetical protein GQ600_11199 [Phytophthora cactorum]|nr:hypothetical protein GQ600_11199 [Phytophthora cactorum]
MVKLHCEKGKSIVTFSTSIVLVKIKELSSNPSDIEVNAISHFHNNGVSQSKGGDDGGVRWKLRPLVPRSWADLEQLHVRFQQEVHRRRAEPALQYFLPFSVFQAIVTPLCPDMDKLQLLAMFEALDLKSKRKLAVMDFFSGLALLVDAKKPQKLECEAMHLVN